MKICSLLRTNISSGKSGVSFGKQADLYRLYRPNYKTVGWLFDYVTKLTLLQRMKVDNHSDPSAPVVALELGAGSGQATSHLLERFDSVVFLVFVLGCLNSRRLRLSRMRLWQP